MKDDFERSQFRRRVILGTLAAASAAVYFAIGSPDLRPVGFIPATAALYFFLSAAIPSIRWPRS
jgi:hypothetical protein